MTPYRTRINPTASKRYIFLSFSTFSWREVRGNSSRLLSLRLKYIRYTNPPAMKLNRIKGHKETLGLLTPPKPEHCKTWARLLAG
jgi:hypothetical protein